MSTFSDSTDEWQRLDWRLLQNSPIALYYNETILADAISWFEDHGYRVVTTSAERMKDEDDLIAHLGEVLDFPSYYGQNLAAFNDCLSDVEIPEDGGLVIVLSQYQEFSIRFPWLAHKLLDIMAINSRRFLLTGKRVIVLVHSADPNIDFEPVGATPVIWNPQEWVNKSRGV